MSAQCTSETCDCIFHYKRGEFVHVQWQGMLVTLVAVPLLVGLVIRLWEWAL